MNTLGKKVKAFRTAPERKWSAERMAQEVGTSRQNIQNLESKGFGHPRYIADLARVMGTSVDVLLDRRDASALAIEAKTTTSGASPLREAVRQMAHYFAGLDNTTREFIATLLPRIAQHPESADEFASLLARIGNPQVADLQSDIGEPTTAASSAIKQSTERNRLGSRLVSSTPIAAKKRKTPE